MTNKNLYKILGIKSNAKYAEVKSAYRKLVKLHHPDAGGDEELIIRINQAWEILKDQSKRALYDSQTQHKDSLLAEAHKREVRNANASEAAKVAQEKATTDSLDFISWINNVYLPIDRKLGQIINPFTKEIKSLSADPYDDLLMNDFCLYIEKSQNLIRKIYQLYRSSPTPKSANIFGLNLYQCISQVEEAFNELERFTMGYVDNYLHDGKEMLNEAKQIRLILQKEHRRLKLL